MRASIAASRLIISIVTATVTVSAMATGGEDIATNGTSKGVPPCSQCHGAQGEGQPQGVPRLGGLDAGYINHELASFADGSRKSEIMQAITAGLEEADRKAVADYYAKLGVPKTPDNTAGNKALISEGAELADVGDWQKRLPGCGECHGAAGPGVGQAVPRLAGQNADYLENQLLAWKTGDRKNDPMGLMASVATKLTDGQIKAVAAYFANLPDATPVRVSTRHLLPQDASPAIGAALNTDGMFQPLPESAIPDGPFGDMVRLGEAIFDDTQHAVPNFIGNDLRCSNCHLDRGRLANSAPLGAAYLLYPAYRSKDGHINTFEERLQGCFRYSMNGKAPPYNDEVLVALESYAYFLAQGAPVGMALPGRGYPKLEKPDQPSDYERGSHVYDAHCALCHGADGAGQKSGDGQTVFPPLWGARSFNWGAGMASIDNAAGFIKANMPLGQGGTLTDQEAWDVAAYVDGHERPQDPRFTGSVETTRKKYHDTPMSEYGQTVGVLLGKNSPPSGTINAP